MSVSTLESLNSICKRLNLGRKPRIVLAIIERREKELGHPIAVRREGRDRSGKHLTGRVVVRVSEAVLRRDVPELFKGQVEAQQHRADKVQMAKVNRALAGLQEQQEQVAGLVLRQYEEHKFDPQLQQIVALINGLRDDLEFIAGFVKDIDTRLQRSAEIDRNDPGFSLEGEGS